METAAFYANTRATICPELIVIVDAAKQASTLLMCAGSTLVGNFSLEITFFIFNATAKVAHRKLQKNTNNSNNNNGLHSLKVQRGLVDAVQWLLLIIIFASAIVVDAFVLYTHELYIYKYEHMYTYYLAFYIPVQSSGFVFAIFQQGIGSSLSKLRGGSLQCACYFYCGS